MKISKDKIEYEAYYKHSIQMALENKFSWTTLASVLDQMTPTLAQSKDLVKVLLDVIQNQQKQYQELVQLEANVRNENNKNDDIANLKEESDLDPSNCFPIQNSVEAEFVEETKVEIDKIEFVQIEDLHHDYKTNFEEDNASQTQNFDEIEFKTIDKDVESFAINTMVDNSSNPPEKGLKNENLFEGTKNENENIKTTKELKSVKPKDESRTDFECKVCGKTFTKPSSLSNHVRIHRDKSHLECKYCYKAFPQPHHLKQHERTHTGERPFGCKFCDKTFSHHFTLTKHERVHTGELPYECEQCEKRFTSSSNLVDHKKIHSMEKPFECKRCGMAFKVKGNMIRHERRHEQKNEYGQILV